MKPSANDVNCSGFDPSLLATQICELPDRSDLKTSLRPSGENCGLVSSLVEATSLRAGGDDSAVASHPNIGIENKAGVGKAGRRSGGAGERDHGSERAGLDTFDAFRRRVRRRFYERLHRALPSPALVLHPTHRPLRVRRLSKPFPGKCAPDCVKRRGSPPANGATNIPVLTVAICRANTSLRPSGETAGKRSPMEGSRSSSKGGRISSSDCPVAADERTSLRLTDLPTDNKRFAISRPRDVVCFNDLPTCFRPLQAAQSERSIHPAQRLYDAHLETMPENCPTPDSEVNRTASLRSTSLT